MKKNYIVFQAYGNDYIFHECFFAILSILRKAGRSDFSFLIYTDRPSKFDWLQLEHVEFEILSTDLLKLYAGEQGFVHRVKIKILEHALNKYQGIFLYLDTDMYAIDDVTKLFEKVSSHQTLMHENEGLIESKYNLIAKKIYNFVDRNAQWLEENKMLLSKKSRMFNAGVIGISNSHTSILSDVLSKTDVLYLKYPKHIIEQIIFSCELNAHTHVVDTSDKLFHYWFFKEFRDILNIFFDFQFKKGRTVNEIINHIQDIDPAVLGASKLEYIQSKNFIVKLWKRISINKWKIPDYRLE
jgi:hypothetical protein